MGSWQKASRRKKRRSEKRSAKARLTGFSLLDDLENMFMDYRRRRRVFIHPIPAPWSRVILFALISALAINIVKFGWFHFFGKPEWYPSAVTTVHDSAEAETASPENKKEAS